MTNKTDILKGIAAAMAFVTTTSCSSPDAPAFGTRTDALADEAWRTSTWISAADAPVVDGVISDENFRAADGAVWFVSNLKNANRVVSARWMTTGLGIYSLYVNGVPVGDEVLKPGFTHYAHTRRSFTYDITAGMDLSKGGETQLAVEVTPGWWADKIITPAGHEGMLGRKVAFRGVVELTYNDGTTQCFGTNLTDWKAGVAGPVTHAAIYDGETYDARIAPGYLTPELLVAPVENDEFQGDILPSEGAEIYLRSDLALAPVKAYVWKGVEAATDEAYGKVVIIREYDEPGAEMTLDAGETLVVDFGQNCSAIPEFVFKAAEGTKFTCLPSELLNDGNGAKSRGMDGPEGSVHRLNLRIPDHGIRLDYTFAASDDFVTYRPHCTFFGYRFVSLTATAPVTLRSVRSIPVSSIIQHLETGTITTGNPDINRLISNTLWGQRSNYLSVPTDCPQRNERLGWTADTQVFAETGTFFANTRQFFHKWTRDLRDTQSPKGGFPGVAPWGQYGSSESDMMRLGWADAGIIVPWTVWKQYADTAIVNENWEAMDRFVRHAYEVKYDHTALASENGNYQWADWLSYEPLESWSGAAFDRQGPRPDAVTYWSYLGACYLVIDAEMMRDMASATGRDAAPYQQMADDTRSYIRERFFTPKGEFRLALLNTMQTPALFALKTRLVEGEARERMLARLRNNFIQHDGCLQTGFLGTSILMPTLTENGMSDIAYTLLFQRKNPSWLYSVDNGATTIWERWNSYMIEKGMGPRGMNSFNHYAYGCVCQWLWENAAGIAADTANPGFCHIIMRPVPDERLGYVKAEYQSAVGLVTSHWRYEGDTWVWEFSIPEGATASVTLPGTAETKEYNPGSYTLRLNLL